MGFVSAAVVALADLVAGCASTGSSSLIGPLTSGTPSSLSADEMTWNCDRLENAVNSKVARIVELQKAAKTEAKTAAPTLERMFERWSFGNTESNNDSLASIKIERAQADAYNARLPVVGCAGIDIDAKIAAATPK